MNSTAAEETLMAPLQMLVSVRTRLPAEMEDFIIADKIGPALPSS
jgi:hypothetical protein